MNQYSEKENLKIFKILFKGREDVFAVRWEKGNRNGYMPAYRYDPYMYRLHKMNGGSFKDFNNKTYLTLTEHQLQKHFNGEQLIGIYPLLKNNTSWFIAADFDKDHWAEESLSFINKCNELGIPAYLERSRSGNGGHVWIFFDRAYPAVKSRKLLIALLEQTGVFSVFDKSSSFDRLFPNQDFLSGKGLGNLIALPFYKPALENGNSCFIDNRLKSFENQWDFLRSVKQVSVSHLDDIYNSLFPNNGQICIKINSERLQIRLNHKVHLNRAGVSNRLISFLKEELNFANSDYFIKKKTGRNTWGTERYFRFIEETEQEVIVPRGFVGKLIRFCKSQSIEFDFLDERQKPGSVQFNINLILRNHQKLAVDAAKKKEFGIISAPPGCGKTVIGLKIIAEKVQPALIVAHRKQIFEQWLESIQAFLGIPKHEIGRIGQGKAKTGKLITVAMIQSLGAYLEKQETDDFAWSFGTLIIDECHHIPTETYRNTISKFPAYFQYGLTATPFRKGNDGKLIFIYMREIIAKIQPQEIEKHKQTRVIVRETELEAPFNPKTDLFETLSKILTHDSARNKLILQDISSELNKGKKAVILTERKEHISALVQFLKQSFETVALSGDDSESQRKAKWQLLKNGNYQALITTGQLFGEGADLQNASCLFLVYPFAFKGKLIQYIGRVQRAKIAPVIYDYRDRKIEYLNRLFLKRNAYFRQLERQATLFDDVEIPKNHSLKMRCIDKKIKISIDELDFRYGAIAFHYIIPGIKPALEFEIENDDIRPEFDVLKPYFSKALKLKFVEIQIYAEFENGMLMSQHASSDDLCKINPEVVEGVRFRFIEHSILNRKSQVAENNLLDLKAIQNGKNDKPFYASDQEFVDDILKNEKYKHYRQLKYLAAKHERAILKLRFVLNPFSFLFLLAGTQQYHLILETLDTEEATYIWRIEKNEPSIQEKLSLIEEDLNLIRNNGRQAFLETQPANFSRIFHDYSDTRKGFVIWKALLEERLV